MEVQRTAEQESCEIVQERFMNFLETFVGLDEEDEALIVDANTSGLQSQGSTQRLLVDYLSQLNFMMQNNRSTVYVNFEHIAQVDHELAEAIELEFYRFEPYLRNAVRAIVAKDNEHYVYDVDKGQRHFFVAFYNLTCVDRIRSMKTEKIGRLIAVSGTVTRSSEVRPELLYATFVCQKCGARHVSVEQQYQFTEPQICTNTECAKGTRGDFQLILDQSAFVDWQRLRVQENADEIPPGSMPRCIDIICRNEVTEIAKAGDKVIFTGHIIVVPDSSGLARAGEAAMSTRSSGRGEYNNGVTGLKKLGVSEMTYKMLFVASSVQQTDQRTGRAANMATSLLELGGVAAQSGEAEGTVDLSTSEKQEILTLRHTPDIYRKMVESICPTGKHTHTHAHTQTNTHTNIKHT